MKVKPVLGDWEIPHIALLRTLERRTYVEHEIPGRAASLYQDLNTAPARIAIAGSLYGDEARDEFLAEVRGKFQSGEPLTFVADIVTATQIQHVIIEALELEESGTPPDEIEYSMVLRESPPPPPPADPFGALDTGLLADAESFLDSATNALSVIDTLTSVPDLGDPTPPLRGALDGVKAATDGLDAIAADLTNLFAEREEPET